MYMVNKRMLNKRNVCFLPAFCTLTQFLISVGMKVGGDGERQGGIERETERKIETKRQRETKCLI